METSARAVRQSRTDPDETDEMPLTPVRPAGLDGPRLGLGGLALAGAYGTASFADAVRLARFALDTGTVLFDAADPPGHRRAERIIGRAVQGRREDALICAHVPASAVAAGPGRWCDAALRRLGTSWIDLCWLPAAPAGVPVEECAASLASLVEAGKVRYLGSSGLAASQLTRAHAVHPVTAVAVEYSLAQREDENDRIPLARQLGIGVLAAAPLGRGLLAGRTGASRRSGPPLRREQVSRLQRIAAELDVGVARLALAWLLSRGGDVVPVPSTRNRIHCEMNRSALDVELAPGTVAALDELFPPARRATGTG